MDEELDKAARSMGATVSAPGFASMIAVRWLISYLASKGDAQAMLSSLEKADFTFDEPEMNAISANFHQDLLGDLKSLVDGRPPQPQR